MSHSIFLRKWLILFLPLFFVACNKDEIKLRKMASIPVSDAAYIFTREGSRASSGEGMGGVWKVTLDGEEVKLTVKDDEGNDVDVEILSVQDMLGNYLIVDTEVGRVLVDKKTNKIYECPNRLCIDERVEEYPSGTLYYIADQGKIYKSKISSQSIIEEQLLPEGETGTDFFIGQNGTIYYSTVFTVYHGEGIVMTQGKHMYPITEDRSTCVMFGSADHNIYSLEGERGEFSIYKWENVSDYEIEKKQICKIPFELDDDGDVNIYAYDYYQYFAPINTVSGNVVLFVGTSVYEFDGQSCILKRTYSGEELKFRNELLDRQMYVRPGESYKTISKFVFFEDAPCNNGNAISLDPRTYEVESISYEIPEDQYEIRSTKSHPSWGKMLFTALRYSDGSTVLGEVDDKGNFTIVSERASTYEITEYIALN